MSNEPGKRVWKTYENGIELDGVFIATEIAASLQVGDPIKVVEVDGQKYLVKGKPETKSPR